MSEWDTDVAVVRDEDEARAIAARLPAAGSVRSSPGNLRRKGLSTSRCKPKISPPPSWRSGLPAWAASKVGWSPRTPSDPA
jgi:hypothetical protein